MSENLKPCPVARIRRPGWRMKPIHRWYDESKKADDGSFENILRGAMEIEAAKPIPGNHSR